MVCDTGSAILDCPLQYQTSPKVTSVIFAAYSGPIVTTIR